MHVLCLVDTVYIRCYILRHSQLLKKQGNGVLAVNKQMKGNDNEY